MKIIVAIKQVPARDSSVRIDTESRWIDEQDLSFEINEPDAYALEAALLLKEKHSGEVVVLCAGPERAGQTIREALAALDTLAVARRLASAVSAEKPDLILTGLQSDDLGLGQTGVVMAELLAIPHASIIMEVEVEGGSLRVKRELEDGWFQWVRMPLPALLTIQSGISKLRYATLMGIKKAKTKEVRRVAAADLPAPGPQAVSIDRVYLPHRKKETRIITGPAAEAAAKMADVLKFEVRVI